MSNSSAIYPDEFNSDLLQLGERMRHNDRDDWSADLIYDGIPLQIQTPYMHNVFGLSSYTNSNNKTSYSLSFELRNDAPQIKEFRNFIEKFETWLKGQFEIVDIKGEFFSSIRPSKREDLPDTFRVKLKVRKDRFDVKCFRNRINEKWIITDKTVVQHRDRARLVLELMPVWSAGGKVGVSWKAVTIQIVKPPDFRDDRDAS
jgi:hypothetical protein